MFQIRRVCAGIAVAIAAASLAAQEKVEIDPAARFYNSFAKTAESFSIHAVDSLQPLVLQTEPLQRFSVAGRTFGSVYVWHDCDRRLAVTGTIGSIPLQGQDFEFIELHLLKPMGILPLEVAGMPTKIWTPSTASLSLKPVLESPEVGGTEHQRLRQMRSMARDFTGEVTVDGRVEKLRLLPQPLYRYEDLTRELDGAVFALINDGGTDPEILIRIETSYLNGDKSTSSKWHYQPIRFTWRKLTLSHKNRPVWDVPEFLSRNLRRQTTPYITGLTRALKK